MDYISCWFFKGANYLNSHVKLGFVTTNSVNQGGHVELLWPLILEKLENEIFFAVKDFKWTNSAKKKAGVTCSIIGLRKESNKSKYLYIENRKVNVENINAYLLDGKNLIVQKRQKPLSTQLPEMVSGNMALDYGHLLLSTKEKNQIVLEYPQARNFIRETTGGKDYLYDKKKWCLWIEDNELEQAMNISPIADRVQKCKEDRSNGGEVAVTLVDRPHQFRYRHTAERNQIVVPLTTSERRKYIPIGFLDSNVIVQQSVQVIYDPHPYILGIISSRMHMEWVNLVSGKLETRISYSVGYSYNTFPFPKISDNRISEINQCVFRILEEREKHPEKTLAELYDPDIMPVGLKEAHSANDEVIEKCYRSTPFESNEQRLEYLFKLYEEMIEAEKTKA